MDIKVTKTTLRLPNNNMGKEESGKDQQSNLTPI